MHTFYTHLYMYLILCSNNGAYCSSSVRRHSMREKHRLSMREARDEASFRISINTQDRDDNSAPTSPDDTSSVGDNQVCVYCTFLPTMPVILFVLPSDCRTASITTNTKFSCRWGGSLGSVLSELQVFYLKLLILLLNCLEQVMYLPVKQQLMR